MQGHVHGNREGLLAQIGEEQVVDRLGVKRIHKAAPLLNLKVCSEDKAAARRACLRGRLWDLTRKACLWDLGPRACLWAYPQGPPVGLPAELRGDVRVDLLEGLRGGIEGLGDLPDELLGLHEAGTELGEARRVGTGCLALPLPLELGEKGSMREMTFSTSACC